MSLFFFPLPSQISFFLLSLGSFSWNYGRVFGWSDGAWDPALGCILMESVKATDRRFEVEVQITAVMDMSSVSAGTLFVSIVVVPPADNFPQTLRVKALSLGKESDDEFVTGEPQHDLQ